MVRGWVMKKVVVFLTFLMVMGASSVMAYQCAKGPSREAGQLFTSIVENLVKGNTQAILKVSNEKIRAKVQDFKKMVDYVASYGEPKSMSLIGYKCYPQDPGFERFYGVLCYPKKKAMGVDITLTHTEKGLILRHLRLDVREGLEKFCR